MEELLRTTDLVLINAIKSYLKSDGIDVFELDAHMSVLEGSISVLVPRRLMVAPHHLARARMIIKDAALGDYLSPAKSSQP
ncbi:MAG: DUF2007 domain-containing protein [Pseudomonadota bacterium]